MGLRKFIMKIFNLYNYANKKNNVLIKLLKHNPRDNMFQFWNRKYANENINLL